jgi:biofilm PGA synthesis N-glycosyltransferase PgaC
LIKKKKQISVAIGIPVYNEEENIERLLMDLLVQKIEEPFKLERILVVASGCTDNTPKIVKALQNNNDIIELIEEEERRGKASALNIIFQELSSDIIVLMGGDVLPRERALINLVRPFQYDSVGAVGGHPKPINKPIKFADTTSCLIWDLHHFFSKEVDVKLSGEFFAIRQGPIKKIFSKINCDDALIGFLIRKLNYKLIYSSKALVDIKGPDNIKDLLMQRRRIHAGHRQLKKITGTSVGTTGFFNNLSALVKIFKKYYSNKWFFPSILIEIIARLLGYIDSLKGNYHGVWERVNSTKYLKIKR